VKLRIDRRDPWRDSGREIAQKNEALTLENTIPWQKIAEATET